MGQTKRRRKKQGRIGRFRDRLMWKPVTKQKPSSNPVSSKMAMLQHRRKWRYRIWVSPSYFRLPIFWVICAMNFPIAPLAPAIGADEEIRNVSKPCMRPVLVVKPMRRDIPSFAAAHAGCHNHI